MSSGAVLPRLVDWLPGVGLFRRGSRVAGVSFAVVTAALIALGVFRAQRIAEAVEVLGATAYVGSREISPQFATDTLVAAVVLVVATIASFAASRAAIRPRAERTSEAEPVPRWRRRIFTNRQIRLAAGTLVALYLVALLSPLLAPYDPVAIGNIDTQRLLAPGPAHLLGTDRFARDVLSRLLWGSRVSLFVGILAVAISVSIGSLYGAIAGYAGGWIDAVLMRLLDALLCFPMILLVIACVGFLETRSVWLVVTVIGLFSWMDVARLVRGQLLALVRRDWFLAVRGLGASAPRLILRHLLPNALTPVIVFATLRIGSVILLEASLGFLGLGVSPPTPSWGGMINESRGQIFSSWWIPLSAGLAIVVTVTAWHLLGDGLRDALDPRLDVAPREAFRGEVPARDGKELRA